ncbi:MAG: SGNH/GDSL hydrolase family protein [Arenicellales bacterium]
MNNLYTITRIIVPNILVFFALFSSHAFAAQTNGAGTIKILVLGDSITQAESNRASFRYPLWKKLVDADLDFDFVGSMNRQFGRYNPGPPPHDDYRGLKFDPDHEGHFAWTADEIIRGRSVDNGSGAGRLQDWLAKYDADIVLIHLGTNDAFMRQSNQSTGEELKNIIELLREDNSKVSILLARLIPTTRAANDTKAVISLNETITTLSKTLGTADSPVILVDQFAGFDGKADLYDKVHPNASGEEKMAEKWFDAIQRVLKK